MDGTQPETGGEKEKREKNPKLAGTFINFKTAVLDYLLISMQIYYTKPKFSAS